VQRAFTNDFIVHHRPGGIFGFVGPTGPHGAFGPLAPLGPIGAHGYVRQGGGDYYPNAFDVCHNVEGAKRTPPCRTIDVDWSADERRGYELFEEYSEDKAKSLNDKQGDEANDTSFVVHGDIREPGAEVDEFVFRSRSAQWVMLTLVPESAKFEQHQLFGGTSGCDKTILAAASEGNYEAPDEKEIPVPHVERRSDPCSAIKYEHRAAHDDFDVELEIRAPNGKRTRVRSRSREMIDWVQVLVPKDAKLTARVSLSSMWKPLPQDARAGIVTRSAPPSYRLFVVGSSPHFVLRTRFSGAFSQSARFE
jgi:hypothetical protein